MRGKAADKWGSRQLLLRHSHGGLRFGSAHKPFLTSHALTRPAPYPSAHASDTTGTGSRGHSHLTKRTFSGTVRIQEATTVDE